MRTEKEGDNMFSLTPYDRKGYDLFNAFRDFEKDFFNDFGTSVLSGFNTDIRDEGNRYELEAELPGFQKGDINVNIDGDCLTIAAERKSTGEEKDKSGNYIRRERSYSSYRRSFDISNVDSSAVSAEYTDGILKLSLPKRNPQVSASKRIEIS